MEQKPEEFLPCPFCGKKPSLHKSHFKWSLFHSCDAVKSNVGRGDKKELLKIWNKRVK